MLVMSADYSETFQTNKQIIGTYNYQKFLYIKREMRHLT